jgi:hypothetical protein
MQRTYRGYLGRREYLEALHRVRLNRQRAVYDYFATTIQRMFRGFYSRKWRSDFYSQKQYLHTIEARSQQVRQLAEDARAQQEVDLAEAEDREQRHKFRETAGGLHHLLSTAVRSGVLRPAVSSTGLQTVFGTNIEDDLRDAAADANSAPKRKFRSDLIPRKGENAPPKGGSPLPYYGVGNAKYSRSLQSSEAFDAEREQSLLDRAVDAKMASNFHQHAFVARKANPPPAPLTLNAGSQYQPEKSATGKR